MDTASEAPAGIAFGRFLLLPHRRELLADGRPVKLGGRAFDVLMALIEARGAVVSKNALMARVWPDRIVEENNLQWQISALRAAFGADRNLIRTVSGRGYQFTAENRHRIRQPGGRCDTAIADAPPDPREARRGGGLPPTNLQEPISELIGRDDVLGEILSLAAAHRLVTLTGAGGIGKAQLAIAAARLLLPQFADGVWLAEFSPIADPGLVSVTVAAPIGLDLGPVVSPRAVSLRVIQCQLAVQPDAGTQHAAGGDLVLADKTVSHDLSLQRAKPALIVRGREIGQRRQEFLRGAERVDRPYACSAHRALQCSHPGLPSRMEQRFVRLRFDRTETVHPAHVRMPAPVVSCSRMRSTTSSVTGRRPSRFPWLRARERPALPLGGKILGSQFDRRAVRGAVGGVVPGVAIAR